MLSQLYEWSGGNGIEHAALIKEWLRKKWSVAKSFLFYFTKSKPLHPSNNCLQHQVPQSYRLFCLHKVNNAGSKVSSDCMSSQALQLVLEWRSCGWRIALWTLGLMRLMDGQRRDKAFIPPEWTTVLVQFRLSLTGLINWFTCLPANDRAGVLHRAKWSPRDFFIVPHCHH